MEASFSVTCDRTTRSGTWKSARASRPPPARAARRTDAGAPATASPPPGPPSRETLHPLDWKISNAGSRRRRSDDGGGVFERKARRRSRRQRQIDAKARAANAATQAKAGKDVADEEEDENAFINKLKREREESSQPEAKDGGPTAAPQLAVATDPDASYDPMRDDEGGEDGVDDAVASLRDEGVNGTAHTNLTASFLHANPCHSNIRTMVKSNMNFNRKATRCNPEALPLAVDSELYMLEDPSEIFAHAENLNKSVSSRVARTGIAAHGDDPATSELSMTAEDALAPLLTITKRSTRPSCALVGSSGQLLARKRGDEIDGHDIVLRINQAPTNGTCGEYTGTKTTVRFLNGRWTYKYAHVDRTPYLPLEKDSILVVSRSSGKDYHRLFSKLRTIRPDVKLRMLSRRVIKTAAEMLKAYRGQARGQLGVSFRGGNTPSSGLVALVFAFNVCSRVSIYGFGLLGKFDRVKNNKKFYHYFAHMLGQRAMDEVHSFDAELSLMASLGQQSAQGGGDAVRFCGFNKRIRYNVTSSDEAGEGEGGGDGGEGEGEGGRGRGGGEGEGAGPESGRRQLY